MRRGILLSIDVGLVALATIGGVLIRDNFEVVPDRWMGLIPYLVVSMSSAGLVFLAGRLNRGVWRYSSIPDYLQIVLLTVVVILLTLGLVFSINRLEGVPRALPVLQGVLIVAALVSARVGVRLWHSRHLVQASETCGLNRVETVLIVGVNAITDLFLRSVQELGSHHVRVAGIISEEPIAGRRSVQQYEILGGMEQINDILADLHIHGMDIDRIVVAAAAQKLSARAKELLLQIEESSSIVIHFLAERLGLERGPTHSDASPDSYQGAIPRRAGTSFRYLEPVYGTGGAFWTLKRVIDSVLAAILLLTMSPIIAAVGAAVVLDVGFPFIFWQQRPGLYGRPFRMYKFRTMRAAHDRDLNLIPDDQRTSFLGSWIRRVRFDELPQLYNILLGHMSFVGPRPLLPRDQSPDHAARLSVRPGVTGWAQINGGRIISAADKALLDIWYVRKATLWLDLKIVFRTVNMVFFGDRVNIDVIRQARADLSGEAPVLSPPLPGNENLPSRIRLGFR